MKKIIFVLSFLLLFLGSAKVTKAIYNPTLVPDNHFGIHVADTSDLSDVAKLINSSAGDWGYITIVIQKGERDTNKWQSIFNQMRRLHLIPIVRIATAPIPGNNNTWEKPSVNEIDGWISFLNSLNWVVKNRYVIIANEPNHASEWGGEVNPAEYASYLKIFSQKLKASSDDFFIMPAGLDASATTSRILTENSSTMDESIYLEKMFEEDPNVFEFIDGWASHSYPNPNFSGNPLATGKGSVATFDWELNYLKFLGFKKDLPVFITETGWTHGTGNLVTGMGPKFVEAFKNIWSDKRIVAITPFIYKYINPPFDIFSWVSKDNEPYDFYSNVENLPKISGMPIQIENGTIITGIFPKIAVAGDSYTGILLVKNTGQSIWTKDIFSNIESLFPISVEPNQVGVFLIKGVFRTKISGNYNKNISLVTNGKVITENFVENFSLIPKLPSLSDIFNYIKIAITRKITLLYNFKK